MLIDRWPLLWRDPGRGDVVAFREPGASGDLAIKRVAGLPGEQLVIDNGDLLAGQQTIRKSPAQFHAQRLLVHDNHFQPRKTKDLPARWRSKNDSSRWRQTATGYRLDSAAESDAPFDWLHYEHWPCTADRRTRGIASPILDNDSFNQGETHRPLNSVTDVIVSCRFRATGGGTITLAATDGDERFEIVIEPRKRVSLRLGEQTLLEQPIRMDFSRRGVEIEFGLCDQQVLLLVNHMTVIRHAYHRTTNTTAEPLHPLAIGASSLQLEIDDLRVWRDIHYLDSAGLSRRWQASAPLAADQFALLGDNQPVSIDSRHWQSPGIPRRAILGHVYKPFWIAQ